MATYGKYGSKPDGTANSFETNMKVVHLTSVHPPFDVRIFHKECRTLAQAGHDVVLIACHDRDETVDGVRIHATRRPKSRLERMTRTTWQILRAALDEKADIYHFHDPELIPAALFLKYSGYKVIYDIHEDLPQQILVKSWMPHWIRKPVASAMKFTEAFSARRFDALCVPAVSFLEKFRKLNRNTALVRNFVTSEFAAPDQRKINPRHLLHAGGLSDQRGLTNMLNVLGRLPNDVKLLLAGPFANAQAAQQAKTHPYWNRVEYFGVLSHSELRKLYQKAAVGLILYNNVGQYGGSTAVKLYEFMLWEIPVVMPDFGDWPMFNREHNCGVCVDVTNPAEASRTIHALLDDPEWARELGRRGRAAALQNFVWEAEARTLVSLYESLSQ